MPAFALVCLIAAFLLLLPSLPALLQKKLHLGVVFPAAAALVLLLYSGIARAFPESRALYVCGAVLTALIAAGATVMLVCSLFMCFGWRRFDGRIAKGDETVLVLGCRVYPDHLSKMLVGRLSAAYTLLCRYPRMRCIVSGGQGGDEPCTEAAAMKRWLVAKGIEPERIIEEGDSRSTMQNFSCSARLIQKHGFSSRVIVATDYFHQFRSSLLAKSKGLNPCGTASVREPLLLPGYWLREMPGILCAWVLLLRRKGVLHK